MISLQNIVNKVREINQYTENIFGDMFYLENLANDVEIAEQRGVSMGSIRNDVLNQRLNIENNFNNILKQLDNKYLEFILVKDKILNVNYSDLLSDIDINNDDVNEIKYVELYASLLSNKNILEDIKLKIDDWNINTFGDTNLINLEPLLLLHTEVVTALSDFERILEEVSNNLYVLSD